MMKKELNLIRETFSKWLFPLFVAIFTLLCVYPLNAQVDTKGTDFWLTFGRNRNYKASNSSDQVSLQIRIVGGDQDADVKIHFTGLGTQPGANVSFSVAAGGVRTYTLTASQNEAVYNIASGTSDRSIHITTSAPVSAYAMNQAFASTDATNLLPVPVWGTEYYQISYAPGTNMTPTLNDAYAVIATENNTQVYHNGKLEATLQTGQVYHCTKPSDMTGARITSNKPVAFFAMNESTYIPADVTAMDILFQQLAPVNTWGKNFFIPVTNQTRDFVRIVVSQNGTNITQTGGTIRNVSGGQKTLNNLQAGQWVELQIELGKKGCHIQADKPVGVCAYLTGGAYNLIGGKGSDPSQAWVPALEQSVVSGLIAPFIPGSKDSQLTGHLALIVTPTATKNNTVVSIGGATPVALSDGQWYDNDAAGMSFYDMPLTNKQASYVFTNPAGLIILGYGNGAAESYYYLASSGMRDLTFAFYANDIYYQDLPEEVFYVHDIEFRAKIEGDISTKAGHLKWYIDGVEYTPARDLITWSINLPNGVYPVKMEILMQDNVTVKVVESVLTINDGIEKEEEIMICKGSTLTFTATPNPTNGCSSPSYQWKKNGVDVKGATGDKYTCTPENGDVIICEMTSNANCFVPRPVILLKAIIIVVEPGTPVIWTPEKNTGAADTEKQDWNIAENWTPAIVPLACHNVYIPGVCSHYPVLTSPVECNNIYFIQGAELGRPDLLTYNRAYVQLNFGLKQFPQEAINYPDLLKNNDTFNRMLYSAAVSAKPLERERWYMLSSPLKGVVTGDLGFGGFPLAFLKKFGPNKSNPNYPVGEWTTPFKSMTEPAASSATDGFAYFMYGHGMTNNNTGCEESGSFSSLNNLSYLPNIRNGKNYGIKETNGIIELPFFADSTSLYAHRTQVYDFASNKSTFYSVDDGVRDPADFNKLMGTSVSIVREPNNGNYRFAAEDAQGNFRKTIYHSGAGLRGDDVFLVGNPYMSSIDMVAFLNENSNTVQSSFKIWDGTIFRSYMLMYGFIFDVTEQGNAIFDPGIIAPMQGFFLTTTEKYSGMGNVVKFEIDKISTTRHAGSKSNLRSANVKENILRIKAENNAAASYMLIGHKEDASNGFRENEDVRKLFSPFGYVPEIYALAGETPVDINFINAGREVIVPLGIKTTRTGEIRLTFTGMDNYSKASKIELIDARENRTVDLTGKTSYTYIFNHTETGISNGRFSLRIGASMTSLSKVTVSDDLKVYGDSKGIYVVSPSSDPVQRVIAYDFQGRKIFESTSNANYYPLQENLGHSPLIVKVITRNGTKTVKLVISD